VCIRNVGISSQGLLFRSIIPTDSLAAADCVAVKDPSRAHNQKVVLLLESCHKEVQKLARTLSAFELVVQLTLASSDTVNIGTAVDIKAPKKALCFAAVVLAGSKTANS